MKKKKNLNKNDLRITTRYFDDPEKYLKLVPDKIRDSFAEDGCEIICTPYEIFYNSQKNGLFKPLMVFAKDGKPIIGDWDKDIESIPLCAGILNLVEFNTEFNTFIITSDKTGISQQIKLIELTKKLFLHLLYKDQIFNDEFNKYFFLGLNKNSATLSYDIDNIFYIIAIKTSLLERAGCITPYEFLRNILANHVHNVNNEKKGMAGYFCDPFQHGVAARSPYCLDQTISRGHGGPRFHIFASKNKKIYYLYTNDEQQRINFYSVNELLETNFIHINYSIDMEKWHHIITRQIELGQEALIYPATMLAYKKYQTNVRSALVKNSKTSKAIIMDRSDSPKKKPNKFIEKFSKFKNTVLSITSPKTKDLNEANTSAFDNLTTNSDEDILPEISSSSTSLILIGNKKKSISTSSNRASIMVIEEIPSCVQDYEENDGDGDILAQPINRLLKKFTPLM